MAASPLSPKVLDWRRWAVGIAVIAVVGIYQAAPAVLAGDGTAWSRVAVWILFAPLLMLALSTSFDWAMRRRMGSATTVLASLAVTTVVSLAVSVVVWLALWRFPHLMPHAPRPQSYPRVAAFGLVAGVAACAVWALAFVFPFAAEDARLRAVEAEKLAIEAASLRSAAELARLRSQLEPHFILNTLNAIAGLTTQDPREARRLIACLGDLLRDSLRGVDETQTLGEEIDWLRRYAEILESRHAGALCFRWEIEGSAGRVLLPRLLLQPLVENAVKHGALRRDGGGRVLVRASVTGGDGASRLVCTVEDNGPGMPDEPPRSGAFGLRAVRRRIELEVAGGRLEIESSEEGTRATVDLPCVTARAPEVAG
jgi:sensor histidine kinase YesM